MVTDASVCLAIQLASKSEDFHLILYMPHCRNYMFSVACNSRNRAKKHIQNWMKIIIPKMFVVPEMCVSGMTRKLIPETALFPELAATDLRPLHSA